MTDDFLFSILLWQNFPDEAEVHNKSRKYHESKTRVKAVRKALESMLIIHALRETSCLCKYVYFIQDQADFTDDKNVQISVNLTIKGDEVNDRISALPGWFRQASRISTISRIRL